MKNSRSKFKLVSIIMCAKSCYGYAEMLVLWIANNWRHHKDLDVEVNAIDRVLVSSSLGGKWQT